MNDETTVNDTPENEAEVVEPESTPEEVVEEPPAESKDLQSALAQKDHFREKAEKAERERKALEEKLNKAVKSSGNTPLAVEDYIDISTALEGLDQREKAFLAEQHKLSGRPLSELRQTEDFELWQEAYRQRQEKANALKPSATQAIKDAPRTLAERLQVATPAEKEEILREAGLYKETRPREDRASIGVTRTR